MENVEFATANVRQSGNNLTVNHGGDDSLIVSFYNEAVKMGLESEKAGRPIFKDVPFVWIRFPGDRTREVKRKASQEYIARFPRQWDAFQKQQEVVHEGTAIEEWGPISKSTAMTYKGLNIHTVENLAAVNDGVLHQLGHGGRDMRDKARTWLKSSKDGAEAMRLTKENQDLRNDVEMLKQQVAELGQKRGKSDK